MLSYSDEVNFRRAVLAATLVPEPPAPAPPPIMFLVDADGCMYEHPDVAPWRAALSAWGALPSVRRNGRTRQAVEAAVWVASYLGAPLDYNHTIADILTCDGEPVDEYPGDAE